MSAKFTVVRIALIAGACLCVVIGGKWIAWDVVYKVRLDPSLVTINALAFVPIIALAPRYKNGTKIYASVALLETIVIWLGVELTLR